MAESLKQLQFILAFGCGLTPMFACVPNAWGGDLPDPTRPPAALYTAPGSSAHAAPSGPVLQSVFISGKNKLAIINGQTLKLGDKLGEAQLVKIAETEVVLREGKNLQTLKLFPGVEKHSSSQRAGTYSTRGQ